MFGPNAFAWKWHMNERWLPVPIPNLCELYEVSDAGRVCRVKTQGGRRIDPGRILCLREDRKGYLRAVLYYNGKRNCLFVHRLVLLAFLGQPPLGYQTNHINGLKEDNRLENLEWVTPGDNQRHAYRQLGKKHPRGNASLTQEQVREVRTRYTTGEYSQRDLARYFNVSQTSIWRAVNFISWRNIES